MIVAGSDNGKSGWLVFLDENKRIVDIQCCATEAKKMYALLDKHKPVYAVTEEVFMSPGFKGVASTGFIVLGRYIQTFELLDIPYDYVRAVTWRAGIGIKAKGRDNQKLAAIEHCKSIFHEDDQDLLKSNWRHKVDRHFITEFVYDNNKCESALIAYYALCTYNKNKLKEQLNDN